MATTKERLASLENEISNLKRQLTEGRTLEEIRKDIRELRARYQAHEEYVTERLNNFEEHVNERFEGVNKQLQELKEGQHALQAGVDQIIAIITGKAKTND